MEWEVPKIQREVAVNASGGKFLCTGQLPLRGLSSSTLERTLDLYLNPQGY